MSPVSLGSRQITKSKILIVEGIDEEYFFKAYFKFLSISDIQVLPIGGKTLLPDYLDVLITDSNFISKVQVLAIIRDADDNANSAFQSVCSALRNSSLPVPSAPLQPVSNNLIVNVMIMPPGSSSGMLEDLCLRSVSSDPALPCLDSYFSCLLTLPNYSMPKNMSKAKVHAFLSSRIEPDKRLGEAALASYWPFNNVVFDTLKNFILSL